MRIVSCVPSLTELVANLEPEALIGRTKFCIHPEGLKKIPNVGGTKNLDLSKIRILSPDWILAVKEENEKEQIEALQKECRVSVFDIKSLPDALACNFEIARELGKEEKMKEWYRRYTHAKAQFGKFPKIKVAYLIWQDPLMTVGGDTFIGDVMREAYFENVFEGRKRYPQTDIEELKNLQPDLILLSSEPYPFKEKHLIEFQKAFENTEWALVDGTYFSWYGSRLEFTWTYLGQLRNLITKTKN
jgi:ABC-type Fe3+-hydroxamate transport system substrate-binding protein